MTVAKQWIDKFNACLDEDTLKSSHVLRAQQSSVNGDENHIVITLDGKVLASAFADEDDAVYSAYLIGMTIRALEG